jgi:hypothetical protein
MFRSILEFLALLLFFTIARAIIGSLGQAYRAAMQGPAGSDGVKAGTDSEAKAGIQSAGELRKDPVCGTFVATATSVKRVVNGETYYFCGPDCRDRFAFSKK